jgi:virginiamycin A acetyltransferase
LISTGAPAKEIKKRFAPEIMQQLLAIKWWGWPEDQMIRNRPFFDLDLTELLEQSMTNLIEP